MKLNFALLLLCIFSVAAIPAVAQPQHSSLSSPQRKAGTAARVAESVHLNNLGAAYMNQQQFARALNLFRRAAALNPKLEIVKINEGIALANLQKYGAATTILTALARNDHGNAHAWYMLGLVYKNKANSEKSLEAFEAAARR